MDRRRGRTLDLARLIAAALLVACTGSRPSQGLGVRRAAGGARSLLATPDGAWLAYLEHCSETRAQSLPPGTASCELRVVSSSKGEPALLASAVTNLPGAVAASPRGAEIAALADYDYASASGVLVRWRAGEPPKPLAKEVTFLGYGPDGALGYVAGGQFWLASPGADPAPVPGASAAASFELAPKGSELLALVRRRAGAGGELLAVHRGDQGAKAFPVAGQVGDYRFGAGGRYAFIRLAAGGGELRLAEARAASRPEALARAVRAFAFAPRGGAIAYLADASPGKQGDLHVRSGERETVLGREVGEFRWAAEAPRLAWLEEYDPRVRSGSLGVGGPDLPPRILGKNVSDLELSPDGRQVAYLQHSTRGGYSVDLLLSAVDAPEQAPRRVAQATYGFGFSPDGRWLYYRTRCTRDGEGCDLERIAPGSPEAAPERIAEGLKSFEFDPRDPARLLLSWKRFDRDALDLAVWEQGGLLKVDTYVQPGSARFLGTAPIRVGYVVVDEKRAGVYLASLEGPTR
ncbi:MAG TPA: hypothetical protein VFG59_17580 [Anaeromyxobacter sp.]|nr:hypothetical protein [Anaeromyxobacter sp.]